MKCPVLRAEDVNSGRKQGFSHTAGRGKRVLIPRPLREWLVLLPPGTERSGDQIVALFALLRDSGDALEHLLASGRFCLDSA